MKISINLGIWNSVFVVPTEIVDKHIKLAGVFQLKVLLWILRNSSVETSTEDISKALSMNIEDVKDALQYWVEAGIFDRKENEFVPNTDDKVEDNQQDSVLNSNKKIISPVISKIRRPDSVNLSTRIEESEDVKYLMKESQDILGKTLSNGDSSILLMLHDSYGLPVDVLIMLLQYTAEIGKANINYIERTAISWANENIDTFEKAEKKIALLAREKTAFDKVRKIAKLDYHSPTQTELKYCDKWVNDWKFNDILIREAYERCIDSIGKFSYKYTDKIMRTWRSNGINTIRQAVEEKKLKSSDNSNIDYKKDYNKLSIDDDSTYDLDLFDKSSVFND